MMKQLIGLSIVFLLLSALGLHANDAAGPYLGTVKTTEAYLLYRPGKEAALLRLTVHDEQGAKVAAVDSRSEAEHDFVAKFHVEGLAPATTYRYQIEKVEEGNQYLSVPRAMLDDNASVYTVSSWIKPAWLPAHGSADRSFILESNVNNHCELPQASSSGYAISVGLRACGDADKINLQLHTETLVPQPVGSELSPSTRAQGGFDRLLVRSLFSDWIHVAVTFDSKQLELFVNGELAQTHPLPISGPIAETGGLVMGGHRAGHGRNFDGMIDEVAVWNRVLPAAEINAVYTNGIALEQHDN